MRKYLILILLLTSLLAQSQGLRHSVCIVYPNYSSVERARLNEYSMWLSRVGAYRLSRILTTTTRDGYFGSGVVVEQGEKLVLTSRMVVGCAGTATVVFQLHEGLRRYDSCVVLGVDTVTGLALIRLPSNAIGKPLPLASQPCIDGDAVSAASFPMLQSGPSWQLSRGHVSDAYFVNHGRTYLRHTAAVDPGSAGGPLLRKDSAGYAIVGILTDHVFEREEAVVAIPLSDIQHTVQDPLTNEQEAMADLMSFEAMEWTKLLSQLPDSALQSVREEAETSMPLDLMRHVIQYGKEQLVRSGDKLTVRDRLGLVSNINRLGSPVLNYTTFFNSYDSYVGLDLFELAMGPHRMALFGMRFGCLLRTYPPMESTMYEKKPIASPQFGLFTGMQVPVRVANKQLIVPRITAGLSAGPYFTWNDYFYMAREVGLCFTTDLTAGLDYRYEFPAHKGKARKTASGRSIAKMHIEKALSVGLHYDLQFYGTTSPYPEYRAGSIRQPIGQGGIDDDMSLYLCHGLSLRIGLYL